MLWLDNINPDYPGKLAFFLTSEIYLKLIAMLSGDNAKLVIALVAIISILTWGLGFVK